tara:strand:+ start:158 stop:817 length:660 start_codon:yes stop_codon:yes gene_type:complete
LRGAHLIDVLCVHSVDKHPARNIARSLPHLISLSVLPSNSPPASRPPCPFLATHPLYARASADSQLILSKKGQPLSNIWLAAHYTTKLKKKDIFITDITESANSIQYPDAPIALRVSGHLLLGVVRIYQKKVVYLLTDCNEAHTKIKLVRCFERRYLRRALPTRHPRAHRPSPSPSPSPCSPPARGPSICPRAAPSRRRAVTPRAARTRRRCPTARLAS